MPSRFSKNSILVVAFLVSVMSTPASAYQPIFDKKFSNCAELVKVYPGGVAKTSKSVNKGGKTKKIPTVNSKVYSENSSKDRDKDGIACEN